MSLQAAEYHHSVHMFRRLGVQEQREGQGPSAVQSRRQEILIWLAAMAHPGQRQD